MTPDSHCPQKTTLQETNISYLNKKGKSSAQKCLTGMGYGTVANKVIAVGLHWTQDIFEDTPPKTTMEPQNEGLEDGFPFKGGDFRRSIPSETLILLNKKRPEQKWASLDKTPPFSELFFGTQTRDRHLPGFLLRNSWDLFRWQVTSEIQQQLPQAGSISWSTYANLWMVPQNNDPRGHIYIYTYIIYICTDVMYRKHMYI